MKDKNNQVKKPQETVVDIIKRNTVIIFLCWVTLLMPENQLESHYVEVGLSIIGILYPVFNLFIIKNIRDASQIHLTWFLVVVPIVILIFDTSIRLLINVANLGVSLFYALLALMIAFSTTFIAVAILYIRRKLQKFTNENIDSGRLNIKDGLWDLTKPIHLDSAEKENKLLNMLSRISKLSPIVVTIGFFIARSIDGTSQIILIGVLNFLFGCFILWGGVIELAIYFQIREWESKFNIKLRLLP